MLDARARSASVKSGRAFMRYRVDRDRRMSTLPSWIEDRIDPKPSRALTQRRVAEVMLTADRPFFLGHPTRGAGRPGYRRGATPGAARGTPRARRRRRRDVSGGDDPLLYRSPRSGRLVSRRRDAAGCESARSALGAGLLVASRTRRDRDARPRGLSTQPGVVPPRDRLGRYRTRGTGPQRPRALDRRTEPAPALCRAPAHRANRSTGPFATGSVLIRARTQRVSHPITDRVYGRNIAFGARQIHLGV